MAVWDYPWMGVDGDNVKVDGHTKCDTTVFNILVQIPGFSDSQVIDESLASIMNDILQDERAA